MHHWIQSGRNRNIYISIVTIPWLFEWWAVSDCNLWLIIYLVWYFFVFCWVIWMKMAGMWFARFRTIKKVVFDQDRLSERIHRSYQSYIVYSQLYIYRKHWKSHWVQIWKWCFWAWPNIVSLLFAAGSRLLRKPIWCAWFVKMLPMPGTKAYIYIYNNQKWMHRLIQYI
jgi:hypothetical protein